MSDNNRFAVIGNPIGHSLSPRIHADFARQCGISIEYLAINIAAQGDEFEHRVREFFAADGRGLNITLPFKLRAAQLAEISSERVQLSSAANTLLMSNGKLKAENTDGVGLVAEIKRLQWDLRECRLVILGAGGAVAGIIPALLEEGIKSCVVLNRNWQRAATLLEGFTSKADKLGVAISAGGLDQNISQCDLMINALGVTADFDYAKLICKATRCYDLNYSLEQLTPFCLAAAKCGTKHYIDGLGMLVFQAAESFFLWHRQRPNAGLTLTLLREK